MISERLPYRDRRGFIFFPASEIEAGSVAKGDEIKFFTGWARSARLVVMQVVSVVQAADMEQGMFSAEITASTVNRKPEIAQEFGCRTLRSVTEGVPIEFIDDYYRNTAIRPRPGSMWHGHEEPPLYEL